MGALGTDTAVTPVEGAPGRFTHRLARDWQIWGPNGGYIASVALRAAGATTALARPASFSCLFLGMASYEEDTVDVEVSSIRAAKRTEALRVCISQGDKPVLEAHVWAVADGLAGLEHDVTVAPAVPGPDELKTFAELVPDEKVHSFWQNFEGKPVDFVPPEDWPPPPPVAPEVKQWMKFMPDSRFEDPWIDACRSMILLDTYQWPAAHRPHLHRGKDEPAFIGPNMDQSVHFHRAAPESEWLLIEAESGLAEAGLMACSSRVWSEDMRLIASASSHLMCREVPRGTPGSGT